MLYSLKKIYAALLRSYQAISRIQAQTSALRLISYNSDVVTGEVHFRVQVTGKNLFPELLLSEIKEKDLITEFNQQDQNIIRHFLARNAGEAELRLVARTYDRVTKQFTFTIESCQHERQIIVDHRHPFIPSNLHKFDQEDSAILWHDALQNTR